MIRSAAERITFTVSIDDLKLVYRTLSAHLTEHLELMDAAFFEELQALLHLRAREAGVDIGDHHAWVTWLRGEADPVG